jgi:anti-sigma B factor antagonist
MSAWQVPLDATTETAGFAAHEFACVWWRDGPDFARVRVCGELDLATTPELRRALSDALGQARFVALDLRALAFTDSTGVHAIVDASTSARRSDRRLMLLNLPAHAARIFELTGTARHVEFCR